MDQRRDYVVQHTRFKGFICTYTVEKIETENCQIPNARKNKKANLLTIRVNENKRSQTSVLSSGHLDVCTFKIQYRICQPIGYIIARVTPPLNGWEKAVFGVGGAWARNTSGPSYILICLKTISNSHEVEKHPY